MKRYKGYSPLERALIAQVYHLKASTRKVMKSPKPDLLHDLRGAVLRLDFVLKYFNKWIDADRKIRKEVKETRRTMGELRSLDVSWARIKKDFRRIKGIPAQKRKFEKIMRSKHAQSRRRLIHLLQSSRYKNMVEELELSMGYSRLPHTSPALKEIFKEIRKWKKNKINPECLHRVRIGFKELRYSCEFIHNYEQLDKVAGFQDLLGKRQDAIGVIDIVSRLPLSKMPRLKNGIIREEKDSIRKYEKKFYQRWHKTSLKDLLILSPQ